MKYVHLIVPTVFLILNLVSAEARCEELVKESDLDRVVDVHWSGALTYMDFGSGAATEIPVELNVTKPKPGAYLLKFGYPDEPNANSEERLSIRDEGRKLNNRKVQRRVEEPNGQVRIETQVRGTDNRKKATITMVYTIGKNSLTIQKYVLYDGTEKRFLRNEFRFEREEKPSVVN